MYKDNPVFHWHYECVSCGHKYFVRFYNVAVNPYFDKVRSLECSLYFYRKDQDKCESLLKELDVTKVELDRINDEVKQQLTDFARLKG